MQIAGMSRKGVIQSFITSEMLLLREEFDSSSFPQHDPEQAKIDLEKLAKHDANCNVM
jgi:hypothetical protein